MPQSKIQFQHGMSLSEFIDTFGTEPKCEVALLAVCTLPGAVERALRDPVSCL
jgi:hypothetical protein